MARPGKSKHKVVVSKRTTSADAPISPEQIERGVGQLLSAPSASDLVAQFRELAAQTCHGSAVGMALIDALGGHRDEAASRALVTLAVEAPEKEHRKAARRALHRLQGAGLDVVVPIPEPPATMIVREPLQTVKAMVSPTDGVGSRVLWLVLERPTSQGSAVIFHLAINDVVGLKDMFTDEMSRRRFQTWIEERELRTNMDTVEVPVEYGRALLSEALALNPESKFPIPREFAVRRHQLGGLPPPPAEALIYQHITRDELQQTPNLLAQTETLLDSVPEMDGWAFGYSETLPFARKYEQAELGDLTLNLASKEQRREEAVDEAIDALFTPPLRRAFRRRLEELAYILWQTEREDLARQAVAAAIAITDTGSLRGHPVLREIILLSFEFVFMANDDALGPPPDADRSAYTPI